MATSMKTSIFLILAFIGIAVASLNATATCHNDTCLRAVTGTRHGPGQASTASSDCASFLQTTTTPPPTTVTVTTTTTEHPSGTNIKKRGALATTPAYASACGNATEYSSACFCLGATPGITTAPTPVSLHFPPHPNTTNQKIDNYLNRHRYGHRFTNKQPLRRPHLRPRHPKLQQPKLLLLHRHQLHRFLRPECCLRYLGRLCAGF
jgi:hypothetical protein